MKKSRNSKTKIAASELSWSVRGLIRSNTKLHQELARRLGMGATDLQALEHLMEQPGIGPAELSRRLGIRSASVTAMLDRLEVLGHLSRRVHAQDRRKTELVIDDSAIMAVIGELQPIVAELDAVAAEFSESERGVILLYLDKVADVCLKHGTRK